MTEKEAQTITKKLQSIHTHWYFNNPVPSKEDPKEWCFYFRHKSPLSEILAVTGSDPSSVFYALCTWVEDQDIKLATYHGLHSPVWNCN
jgi:hypothetical protein